MIPMAEERKDAVVLVKAKAGARVAVLREAAQVTIKASPAAVAGVSSPEIRTIMTSAERGRRCSMRALCLYASACEHSACYGPILSSEVRSAKVMREGDAPI